MHLTSFKAESHDSRKFFLPTSPPRLAAESLTKEEQMEFKRLFTPVKIKNMELRNRIAMLPITTGFIESDETVGDRFIDFFCRQSQGWCRTH